MAQATELEIQAVEMFLIAWFKGGGGTDQPLDMGECDKHLGRNSDLIGQLTPDMMNRALSQTARFLGVNLY